MKKRLEEAFAMGEDEETGMEVGILPVNMSESVRAGLEQGDVSKVFLEMEMPPRERVAVTEKIMSLQSILLRQQRVDEKGLPLQLEEAVQKERLRQAGQEAAKNRHAQGAMFRDLDPTCYCPLPARSLRASLRSPDAFCCCGCNNCKRALRARHGSRVR